MNNKLYGKLSGRCNIHGARTKPFKGTTFRHVCEVTGDCAHSRTTRFGKQYIKRKARRNNWETP
ncbi:MAG: hypothetical protein ACXABY_09615 [Candidatus Thorarchaeota archaeon]